MTFITFNNHRQATLKSIREKPQSIKGKKVKVMNRKFTNKSYNMANIHMKNGPIILANKCI